MDPLCPGLLTRPRARTGAGGLGCELSACCHFCPQVGCQVGPHRKGSGRAQGLTVSSASAASTASLCTAPDPQEPAGRDTQGLTRRRHPAQLGPACLLLLSMSPSPAPAQQPPWPGTPWPQGRPIHRISPGVRASSPDAGRQPARLACPHSWLQFSPHWAPGSTWERGPDSRFPEVLEASCGAVRPCITTMELAGPGAGLRKQTCGDERLCSQRSCSLLLESLRAAAKTK